MGKLREILKKIVKRDFSGCSFFKHCEDCIENHNCRALVAEKEIREALPSEDDLEKLINLQVKKLLIHNGTFNLAAQQILSKQIKALYDKRLF